MQDQQGIPLGASKYSSPEEDTVDSRFKGEIRGRTKARWPQGPLSQRYEKKQFRLLGATDEVVAT